MENTQIHTKITNTENIYSMSKGSAFTMENRLDIECAIWASAYKIDRKFAAMDLAHNGHGIWLLAGECLKSLVIPFDQHPLACKLMRSMIDYYGSLYREVHVA